MTAITIDERGRLTLPRKLREGLGDTVVAIRTPHGVVLHPVPQHVDLDVDAAEASGEDAAMDEVG